MFAPTAGFDFLNFDDSDYVTENPHVRAGLSREGIVWAFTSFHAGHWHPLTWLSLMLDCEIFGVRPGPMHLVNVGLHATNALLFFVGLSLVTKRIGLSLIAAALFAVHPLRVESVAWITERKDVLSTAFLLLATGGYLRYCRLGGVRRYVVACALFALALLAKPTVLVWPVALLALDYWPLGRTGPDRRTPVGLVAEKWPMFVLSLTSLAITLSSQESAGAANDGARITIASLQNALVGVTEYLRMSVWPAGLAVFYPLADIAFTKSLVAALLLTGLSVAAFATARGRPYLVAGWWWFCVTLAPVSGIVQFGGQAFADRYSYVPHLGLMVAAVWLVASWVGASAPRSRVAAAGALAVVTSLAVTARAQVAHWQDSETLFRHAISVTDDNYMAHNNLGVALERSGRPGEALIHYGEAVRSNPTWPEARNNLGNAHARAGHFALALEHYGKALEVRPGYAKAHNNLATAYSRMGDLGRAAFHFERAVFLAPDYVEARLALAQSLLRLGRSDEARSHARELLEQRPDWPPARQLARGLGL